MESTAHQQSKCDEDAGKSTGLREEHVHRGLTVKAMRTLLGLIAAGALTSSVRGSLAVVHDCIGRDDHSLTGSMCTPAEVEIVAEERHLRVEALE